MSEFFQDVFFCVGWDNPTPDMFLFPDTLDGRVQPVINGERAELRRHARSVSRADDRHRIHFCSALADMAGKIAVKNLVPAERGYFGLKGKLQFGLVVEGDRLQ